MVNYLLVKAYYPVNKTVSVLSGTGCTKSVSSVFRYKKKPFEDELKTTTTNAKHSKSKNCEQINLVFSQ